MENISEKVVTYTFDEAFKESLEYFNGDELSAKVFINKYALKDSDGNIYEKTPDDMHWRLAKEINRIELKYPNPLMTEQIYDMLKGFKRIVPQGGPMGGIGNNKQIISLSNCFVIGVDGPGDSYGVIMKIDQEQVQLMKRRGGVGHDLSAIRPAGTPVKNSALTSTGVVPFMERYSNSTREVAQDGRRGALMLSISIKHPDAENFIDAKTKKGKITGANVSVRIDDEFMNAVLNEEKYTQQWPVDVPIEKAKVVKEIDAVKIWDKIVHNAWKSAEPGILFWDNIINESPADCYADVGYKTVSTNPCGEVPLCVDDSCRLLAINLYGYVEDPFTENAKFNFRKFRSDAKAAHRIMDSIIDLELEKIDAIINKIKKDPEAAIIKSIELDLWKRMQKKAKEGRRTGIGVTAEGDMLAAMGLTYGTDEATKFSENVHRILAIEVYKSSVILAEERGAFTVWDNKKELNNPFIKRIKFAIAEEMAGHVDQDIRNESEYVIRAWSKTGRRNIALLTIAPTGTTSLMTKTTSGIEPLFLPYYNRNRKVNPNDLSVDIAFTDEIGDSWETYKVFHPKFLKWLKVHGHDVKKVMTMPDEKVDRLVKKSPYYKATSKDVDWVAKVKMQGAVQKWIDHSISVTVNLPKDADEEIVGKVYKEGWKSKCKGITVYRDGSRSGVLVSTKNDDNERNGTKIIKRSAPKRPKELECDIHHVTAKGKDWIVLVGLLYNDPYEVFAFKQKYISISKQIKTGKLIKIKSGYYSLELENGAILGNINEMFERDEEEALTRTLSMALRHGVDIKYSIEQLNKAEGTIISFSKAIARTLKKYIPDNTVPSNAKCPKCDDPVGLVYKEGCEMCKSCGFSKC